MKKNLLLRLCLIMTVLLSLYSCIHEEIISSSDPSTEYINKSLWKEDETYIKNVMQVYFENEAEIKKANGIPFWNYATTVETFDERFLMVPVVSNNKVVSVLQVPRRGSKIYFYYTYYPEHISFFQALVFGKHKKAITRENSTAAKSISCTTQTFAIWYPADESNPDPESGEGSWGTRTVVVCRELLEDCISIIDEFGQCTGGGGNDPGYQYPGGGSDSPPKLPPRKNPCEKTKAISTDPAVTAKVGTLKEQSKIEDGEPNYGEKAFEVKNDGTTSDIIIGEKHKVKLGSEAGKQGAYHNHTPDGIKMLSPPDILKMLNYALAQPNGNLSNGFLGMVGSEECGTCPDGYKYHNYIIRFSGNSQELEKFIFQTNWDREDLMMKYEKRKYQLSTNISYANYKYGPLNSDGLEKLLFDTLQNMGMEGKVNLQRIEDNGTIQNITQNSNGTTSAIPCP
ncbi:hypothetical protein [Chryseobacterium indoltheticum]|uniref:Uncharacterized protein n=1 Tax=Chryseobacterium indoltheticum TaxID=254 RepID=A0A381FHW7_9FLAO|nr:hypothetical protein [Chryseobacterium indoltheticum]SUX46140.1 Uncharacterised protein [Chryseobacterium indoltheticum]